MLHASLARSFTHSLTHSVGGVAYGRAARAEPSLEDVMGAGRQFLKGVLRDVCFMPFAEMCRFKYLVRGGFLP